MIRKAREAWHLLRKHYKEERAKQDGVAVSQARMVKQAKDIPEVRKQLAAVEGPGGSQPIPGAGLRMLDGKPMQFFTDGSLRHALGKRVGKAARKAMKRARRDERAKATSQASR